MQTRFGRIRLNEIAEDWKNHQPINHRLLAIEVAGVLRTLGADEQVLGEHWATVTLFDTASGAGGITLGALANYFDHLSESRNQEIITTTSGSVRTSAVSLACTWLNRIVGEATDRAAIAAGLVYTINASTNNFLLPGGAAPAIHRPVAPSGSAPECLKIREAQQRLEGERSAGEKLEALQHRVQLLEHDNAKLSARLTAKDAQHQQAQEDAERVRRELNEERRRSTNLMEQLRLHVGIIEFMNPENPLSPLEGRRLVSAWCELTDNGTEDVVTRTGIGLREHCRRWLSRDLGAPAVVVVSRFVWALAWPARKKGGVVAKVK